MHIPDGYLSPSTCAALYAGAAPFWWVAFRRVGRQLQARLIPLISLVAAFSFVIMLFNFPLPGGTCGHATGMAVAAIVLGPWGAVVALSVTLLIQAFFFADGGVLAYGANAFNIAVVGPLVASLVYRLVAGRCAPASRRRVLAAALAGYASINAAALCAAVEFGIQPALFRDASGAPLYAPYPLGIAIPAMMVGHLSVAGLSELLLSAGLVSWLQKANPALLQPAGQWLPSSKAVDSASVRWPALRIFWAGMAALMIIAPLGLLGAGTAWGEWAAGDFRNPDVRKQMTSSTFAPPHEAPAGLQRLSAIWKAPIPGYAPPFLRSARLGYVLSAVMGSGLVILACLGIGRVVERKSR